MIVQQIVLQPRAPPCRTTTTVIFMHISVYTCISKVSCVWRLKACYSQSPSRCLSLAWFTIRLPRVITELTISNSDAAINNDASREGCMVVATSTVCVCVYTAAFGCQLCFIFDRIHGRLYVFCFECCLACVRCHATLAQPVIHQLFFLCVLFWLICGTFRWLATGNWPYFATTRQSW